MEAPSDGFGVHPNWARLDLKEVDKPKSKPKPKMSSPISCRGESERERERERGDGESGCRGRMSKGSAGLYKKGDVVGVAKRGLGSGLGRVVNS